MKRLDWIDRWKGILIFLVVAGHFIGSISHFVPRDCVPFCQYLFKAIYVFHMPAFFYIAGMLWRDETSLNTFLRKKISRLLVPYVVFGLISIAVYFVMIPVYRQMTSGAEDSYYDALGLSSIWEALIALIHAGGWPRNEGFRYNTVLWFLPAMFATCLCFRYVTKAIKSRIYLAVVVLVLWFAYAFHAKLEMHPLPWGARVVPWYLGMMLLGYIFPVQRALAWRYSKGAAIPAIMTYLLIVSLLPNYSRFSWSYAWYPVFVVMAVFGIYVSALAAYCCKMDLLKILGINSLGIMLVHKFLMIGIQAKLAAVFESVSKLGTVANFIQMIIVSILVAVASVWITKTIRYLAPWALGEKKRSAK